MKNIQNKKEWINKMKLKNKLGIMVFTFLLIMSMPTASAHQIWSSDCSAIWEDNIYSNQPVCVSGDLDKTSEDGIFPTARVYVVNHQDNWSDGAGLNDVTKGKYNVITGYLMGGGFVDEYVWLPPLKPGLYDLVIDENQNGVYDSNSDYVLSPGFRVIQTTAPITINVTGIKNDSKNMAERWNKTYSHWKRIGTCASAISAVYWGLWAWVTGEWIDWLRCGLDGLKVVSGIAGEFGVDLPLPLDYNSAVMIIGSKVIGNLTKPLVEKYNTLYKDPADPNFMEFVNINITPINNELNQELAPIGLSMKYPFMPLANISYHEAQMKLANDMSEQTAILDALIKSLEKYQGAENANNDYYKYLQARNVKRYSDMMVKNLIYTKESVSNLKVVMVKYGKGNKTYNVTEMKMIQQRILNKGFTPEQIANFRSIGLNDTEIENIRQYIINMDIPSDNYTLIESLDNLTAGINIFIQEFQNLSAQAQQVMNSISVRINHPLADAGDVYVGHEGSPITLNASASSDPNGDTLNYSWDIDLDGEFDDAYGMIVNYSWNYSHSRLIGLKVVDTSGNYDIAYARVNVTNVNSPPIIDSFSPAEFVPNVSYGNSLTFNVTAHDPDGDPLSYNWTLDGVSVSNTSFWTYAPGVTDSGLKLVEVIISDESSLSRDVADFRLVRVFPELPDLAITDIMLPFNLTVGQNVTFPVILVNLGNINSTGLDAVNISFSVYNSFNNNLIYDKNKTINIKNKLYAIVNFSWNATFDIYINVSIDPENKINESNETNNNAVVFPSILSNCSDNDGDGYNGTTGACPEGTDCDDSNSSIHPGVADILNNNIDENCNGYDNITCYADLDNDSYTNNTNIIYTDNGTCPANYKNITAQDCEDSNASIHPDAIDIPNNGIDENCDGQDGTNITCYADLDNDGYTNNSNIIYTNTTCLANYTNTSTAQDCDDNNASIHPGAADICENGIDENCDGMDSPCKVKIKPPKYTVESNPYDICVCEKAVHVVDTNNSWNWWLAQPCLCLKQDRTFWYEDVCTAKKAWGNYWVFTWHDLCANFPKNATTTGNPWPMNTTQILEIKNETIEII